MSWLSQNYEKAAIGGAAVIALGLAAVGWMKVGSVEETFDITPKGAGNNNPAVASAELVPGAIASRDMDLTQSRVEANGRKVDFFTGIPLYVNRNAPNKPVDPYTSEEIHAGIPNSWWLTYNLDPGFGDSPQRDSDGDGFTNLDEYQGHTDPTDPSSYPSIVAKLMFVRDESVTWVLRPGFDVSGGRTFNYKDSNKQTARVTATNAVQPGGIFFNDEGVVKNRFKFLDVQTRDVMNEKTKREEKVDFIRVEDQKPNKAGLVYEIPKFSERDEAKYYQYDRTAVFTLEALGNEGQEFKVEENTTFALPPGSASENYLLKSVTPEQVEVEYTTSDGVKKTVVIPKGQLPQMNQ
ncbi:hypothetical protein JIN85_02070 [Luteolibacter pohnpeiensis]|uniref:Uncharacterized protein n=1 Tax=Luteolibacter pohnpeiensis TaxID=454153 RepID=A0A934VUI8_9BACT|nr:Amuc_1099 family pilus-like system protein [Luteolibacter pohnpeiensis]MBK1881180.1 hypothetical protein [Luteolibacter pohnpeiensis]